MTQYGALLTKQHLLNKWKLIVISKIRIAFQVLTSSLSLFYEIFILQNIYLKISA